jgi:hypothetical protein
MSKIAHLPTLFSDRRYDGFVGLAGRAIVSPHVKARILRFDPGQYQRPAAFGAGWPEVLDKLEIKRVHHGSSPRRRVL